MHLSLYFHVFSRLPQKVFLPTIIQYNNLKAKILQLSVIACGLRDFGDHRAVLDLVAKKDLHKLGMSEDCHELTCIYLLYNIFLIYYIL